MVYKTMKIYITKYTEIITQDWYVCGRVCSEHTGWVGTPGGLLAPDGLRHHVWSRAIFCEVVPLGPTPG